MSARQSGTPPKWSRLFRESRERLGLSRPELAARAGISPSAVKAFERGSRRPREATLNALIDALGISREEANPIRLSAGYAEDWYALFHERYPSDPADLQGQLDRLRWPAFVSNQAIDLVQTNRLFEAVMEVDLSRELLAPGERNFLAQASTPRFAEKFENFDELVVYMIGLVKGDPRWHQTMSRPAPWLQAAVQRFMAGDQEFVRRVLSLWQDAPGLPHRARHIYAVTLRHGDSTLRFQGSTTIADLWAELSWNEWVPADAETWALLQTFSTRVIGGSGPQP